MKIPTSEMVENVLKYGLVTVLVAVAIIGGVTALGNAGKAPAEIQVSHENS